MEEFWTNDTLQEEVVEALIIELPGEESDMFEDDYSEEEASDSDAYFLINFHLFFYIFLIMYKNACNGMCLDFWISNIVCLLEPGYSLRSLSSDSEND